MKQLTFKLSYMRDGVRLDGSAVPDFQEQIAEKLKEHPGYRYSQFIDVPNKCVNVDDGILIIVKDDLSEDIEEKRNQIIAMLYQCMDDQNDARETLKLVDELIELK